MRSGFRPRSISPVSLRVRVTLPRCLGCLFIPLALLRHLSLLRHVLRYGTALLQPQTSTVVFRRSFSHGRGQTCLLKCSQGMVSTADWAELASDASGSEEIRFLDRPLLQFVDVILHGAAHRWAK